MKKSIFLAVAAVAMTACSNDVDLGMKDANKQTADNAIGFEILNKNMSRADPEKLENAGHYNFGVWAYKSTDADHDIMANYLVGYFGTEYGYKKFDTTTVGGMTSSDKGLSKWGYEGLGYGQYNHDSNSSGENFYLKRQKEYMSNIENQYLRYWDLSARYVNFYAYAPYINGTKQVTYTHNTHTIAFPFGTIKDGVDDESLFEYMYAAKKVPTTDFKKAVDLEFKRLSAKVNIAFYENIPGYTVTIDNLKETDYEFISANPAKENSTTLVYSDGLYKSIGADIKFTKTLPPGLSSHILISCAIIPCSFSTVSFVK